MSFSRAPWTLDLWSSSIGGLVLGLTTDPVARTGEFVAGVVGLALAIAVVDLARDRIYRLRTDHPTARVHRLDITPAIHRARHRR